MRTLEALSGKMGVMSAIRSSNRLIKEARALRQRKHRAESNLFLIEGIHHVGAAVEAGWPIEAVLYAPDLLASEYARALLTRLASCIRVEAVSAPLMRSLAEKENPQGILAIARQKHIGPDEAPSLPCSLALLSPQDPGNVGTILRTLDAVGADGLFLLEGGVDVYHPTCVRASMGAIFWKPVVRATFAEFATWARRGHVQLVGTSAHAAADYRSFTPRRPWALVMGSEQKGLSPEQLHACDVNLALPMHGHVRSLNLAVAAGVLLYHFASAGESG